MTEASNFDEDKESRGSLVGTADYISPEAINGEEVSFASDLWALGVIMF
jgi:serine/threonine protein kinase